MAEIEYDEKRFDVIVKARKNTEVRILKPCPFCGYDYPTLQREHTCDTWEIHCANCDFYMWLGAGEKQHIRQRIIDVWNRRAEEE